MTAINSAVAVVQKIPESRSALQSGFEKTKNVVTGNGRVHVTKASDITNLQQSRFVNIQQSWSLI